MNNKALVDRMNILKQDVATLRQEVEEVSEELKGVLALVKEKKC